MPLSPYVAKLRKSVGHELLLLPAVTLVAQRSDRFLLVRQRDTARWSLVGGGIEPGEEPHDAAIREAQEELGCTPVITGIIGSYGGSALATTYPNGDRVSYITTAFRCSLDDHELSLRDGELIDFGWFTVPQTRTLERHQWIDRVLDDAHG
jgi:8-oxo-dGTP pyrophosphatase MutT (NUDIX family)